jgi:hypothetical protein
MKVSKEKLKQIIKEELEAVMKESESDLEEGKGQKHAGMAKKSMAQKLGDEAVGDAIKKSHTTHARAHKRGEKTTKGTKYSPEEQLGEAWTKGDEAEQFPDDIEGGDEAIRPPTSADYDLQAAARAEKGVDSDHTARYSGDQSSHALDVLVGKTLPFHGLQINGEHTSRDSLHTIDEGDKLTFGLGNAIYEVTVNADWGKDWMSGIRQAGRLSRGKQPEAMVKVEKGSEGAFTGFKLVDEKTGKVVALIGDDNADSYYPNVVFTTDPADIQNVLSGGEDELDEMSQLRESFRRFTKLPKSVLKG